MKGGLLLNRSKQVPAEDSAAFGGIAERFRRAGDLDRAIALCRDGLKKFPAMLSARVTLGWALLDKGEYGEARTELEQVLRRAPDNLAAIRGLAELHDRTAHMPDGSPGWHQEQQEALEDLAAAIEAAASSELAAVREALPIEEGVREAFSTEPVLITAAEQAMAAVMAQGGGLAEERRQAFPVEEERRQAFPVEEERREALPVEQEASLVVPMIAFEVDAPELFTDALALDEPGVFTHLVIDEGGEAPPATSQPSRLAVHTQSLEFDVVDLADAQSLEFDSPQAARTQSLAFDPVQTAFTTEERREAFPSEKDRREAFPGREERREAVPGERDRREVFPGQAAAPADPLAEWNTEALDLDLAPVPETIVTLPTSETVELDALATAFASPIAEDVPDCVLEVAPNELVSAEETVTDLQAPVFADQMPSDLGGHIADEMVADVSENAIDGIADDIGGRLGLSALPAFDLTPPDAVGDDEEPIDTPIAAFVSIAPEMPLMALMDERVAVEEPLEAPLEAFAPVTALTPLTPLTPLTIEELFPVVETDVAAPVEIPVAAFAAVMPATIDERFPVVDTGFVLPAAVVQRHPALAPLERLLRQVQARRLELGTASVA